MSLVQGCMGLQRPGPVRAGPHSTGTWCPAQEAGPSWGLNPRAMRLQHQERSSPEGAGSGGSRGTKSQCSLGRAKATVCLCPLACPYLFQLCWVRAMVFRDGLWEARVLGVSNGRGTGQHPVPAG